MANDILQKQQTETLIADSTDYAGSLGTRTDQIDLTDVASGAARQSAKFNLDNVVLATRYAVFAGFEFATAPVSGELVDIWIGFSPSATAGTANPGGLSGSDAAYTGTSGDSLDDSLKQLTFIGSMVCTADATATVQYQFIGWFVAPEKDCIVVVDNNTSDNMHSDAVEMGIRIVPYTDEVQ